MACSNILDGGWCSFCGNDLFRHLFESPHRGVAICDRCTLSGGDTLAELCDVRLPPYYEPVFSDRLNELVVGLPEQHTEPPCSFCQMTSGHSIAGIRGVVCERCVARLCGQLTASLRPHALAEELVAGFPAVVIERSVIDEPTALWTAYPESAELGAFEGSTWRELPTRLLSRHASLLGCAGDTMFHAVVPAYLRYILHEPPGADDMRWQIERQLVRPRRLTGFTASQRETISAVLAAV